MDNNLLEKLLNESESSYLDFKEAQYPFEGADSRAKSEILKDILAFTNAWRRTDAYILIGVQEVKGSKGRVIGVDHHLDDHSLQQFVNSKTQQPVTFSYVPVSYGGVQIGVIWIPSQDRPVYLVKDFGKLKKNVVYIRRGSSTDEATPDEIAKIGSASIQDLSKVSLDLQFANIESRDFRGNSLTLESRVLRLPANYEIPEFSPPRSGFSAGISFSRVNQGYYEQLVRYYEDKWLLRPLGFAVRNLGQTTAYNVRMRIEIGCEEHLRLLSSSDYPSRPPKYFNYLLYPSSGDIVPSTETLKVNLNVYGEKWVLEIEFGSVQPKSNAWSDEVIYIGSADDRSLKLEAQLFADNLSEPIDVCLNVAFCTESVAMDLGALEQMQEEENKRLLEEYMEECR
jgi:hypothetical protein